MKKKNLKKFSENCFKTWLIPSQTAKGLCTSTVQTLFVGTSNSEFTKSKAAVLSHIAKDTTELLTFHLLGILFSALKHSSEFKQPKFTLRPLESTQSLTNKPFAHSLSPDAVTNRPLVSQPENRLPPKYSGRPKTWHRHKVKWGWGHPSEVTVT